ncbi:uncharacterized protein EV420DRAFT_981971 [Desarmillaria tabescens]|uniref:NACHT domain-containing protein n=1 Tax=Armillaria tabescens TaxID=1929756 RepID=A0AA39JR38_ARMTA|nr:uncharacterized protein EV420DRAFT_981971 [Desarmillaria tabescens]KAK0445033.1 hypothetical protein EV420DRAFT_981971 [Desarmillaria tabescens]
MAEVLGIASSITTLIENSLTVIKYLKDVKDAPRERDELLRELKNLNSFLLSTRDVTRIQVAGDPWDPWLVVIQDMKELFDQLDGLILEIKKKLKASSPVWKRTAGRFRWTLTKTSVENILNKIERMKTLIIIARQHDQFALSCAIEAQQKRKAAEAIAAEQQRQMDRKAAEVAASLVSLDYEAIQSHNLARRFGNVGQAFLESPKFLAWVNGRAKSSTLWCPGAPGVGKTILASMIVHYLRARVTDEDIPVLCIYGDYRNAEAWTSTSIIRALLKQTIQAQGRLSSSIESQLYRECHRSRGYLSLDDSILFLTSQMRESPYVYIVLDALDEFEGDYEGWRGLIAILKSLGDNIRLLVTSRVYTDIRKLFEEDDHAKVLVDDGDIQNFVRRKFNVQGHLHELLRNHDDLRNKALADIVEKAGSMYVLADLQLGILAHCRNCADLAAQLEKLPRTMTNAYKSFLERLETVEPNVEHKDFLYRIFGWLALSERPLTVLELEHALAVEPGSKKLNTDNITSCDFITSACIGLVIVDNQECLRFGHRSAQEYFRLNQTSLFPHIQEDIVRTCITYLSFDDFHSSDFANSTVALERYPFLRYSLNHWEHHVKKCTHGFMEEEITRLPKSFPSFSGLSVASFSQAGVEPDS